MSREIDAKGTMGQNYAEALRKLIPAEVLIFYFALMATLPNDFWPTLSLTGVVVLVTPFYLWFAGSVKVMKQVIASTLSVLLYSVLFGSMANFIPESFSWISTLLAMTWTFLVPFLFVKEKE